MPESLCIYLCIVCLGCFWSSLSTLWGLYHSFIAEKCVVYSGFFLFPKFSLSVGPGRECALWWGISVYREPSRAASSSWENRGHWRLTPPFLPVSRLIICTHVYAHLHTHTRRQTSSSKQSCALCDLFISQHAWCIAHQRDSSLGLYSRCRWSYTPVCEYGMKYVLKLECGSMHRCEYFFHLCVCCPPAHSAME